ncbi:MAG: cytochrome c [Lewinella sp.]
MVPRLLLRMLYLGVAGVLFTLAIVCINALTPQPASVADGEQNSMNTGAIGAFPGDSLARVGSTLWKANLCGSCHDGSMRSDMTAPALAGVTDRWAAYPREDLYDWVRNSQRLLGSGHPRATELWAEWGPTVMSNFTNLEDEDVEALLAYIEAVERG